MKSSLIENTFIETQIRCYDGILDLINFLNTIKYEYLHNNTPLEPKNVTEILHDNKVIYILSLLVRNNVIDEVTRKNILQLSYCNAGFELLSHLQDSNYFSGDPSISIEIEHLISFYKEYFPQSISSVHDDTKTQVGDIFDERNTDWYLGEVEDILELVSDIRKSLKLKDIPSHISDIPMRLLRAGILQPVQYNTLIHNLSQADCLTSHLGSLIYYLLTQGILDGDQQVHLSASIFLKKLCQFIPKDKSDYISGEVSKIMNTYSEKKHLEKVFRQRTKRLIMILDGIITNKDFLQNNMPLIYNFLQDLEHTGVLSPKHHARILHLDIEEALYFGITQLISSGFSEEILEIDNDIVQKFRDYFGAYDIGYSEQILHKLRKVKEKNG